MSRRPLPGDVLTLGVEDEAEQWAALAPPDDIEVTVQESLGWAELLAVTQVIDGRPCPGVIAAQPTGAWWWVRQPSPEA